MTCITIVMYVLVFAGAEVFFRMLQIFDGQNAQIFCLTKM
jgi:hypothetical protein